MTVSVDIANSNVNRNITLAGTSIAIFTFLLFFLYPRYSSDQINPILFQLTLGVIVSVIFSLVISGLFYYETTLTPTLDIDLGKRTIFGTVEGFWLLGYSLLLLEPSLILFTVNLLVVALYALALWFSYLTLTLLEYRKLQPSRKK
ncbi:MAG: hypothetical protein OK457_07590 [Thaumarchaeota archaeon]|nr:hypothetical protein [Nitrososphaerota archaeon]